MTTRAQFQARAIEMLADAQLLLAAERAANAYYLGGYAVEMALKAVIARRFLSEDLPDRRFVADIHTHDLRALARLAQLQESFETAEPLLRTRWITVQGWNERSRYDPATQAQAQALVDAIADAGNGVMTWLMTRW